jgi:hypothetical protein
LQEINYSFVISQIDLYRKIYHFFLLLPVLINQQKEKTMTPYNFYNQDIGSQPPPPPPPPPPPQSGNTTVSGGSASTNAIIALVCGILSYIFCPFILGIVAWIMGKGELGKIERGESSEAGRTFAKIGMWLGIVNVILTILAGLFYIVVFVLIMATGSR